MTPAAQPLTPAHVGDATVGLASDWENGTDELTGGQGGPPFTLWRKQGPGGALQLTPLWYHGGKEPQPSEADLVRLVRGWGEQFGGELLDVTSFRAGPLRWATGSYREAPKEGEGEPRFYRVWYGSDGVNIAYATYNCDWSLRDQDRADVDAMIASFRFGDEGHAQAA